MGNDDDDGNDVLAETLAYLTVRPEGDGFVGQAPSWFGDYLFGGFVVAQAIVAVTRDAPDDRRLHSLHAYFLRPAMAAVETTYRVTTLRSGRAFATRHLEATQNGKPLLELSCSFTTDTDGGYVYDLPGHEPPPPLDESTVEPGPGPWVASFLGPTPAAADGTRQSTHRMWFRVPHQLPDDPNLHAAMLGFASDWTGIGGRPLDLEGDTQGMVSLDHAVWFHRPVRADDWLFYDVQSLVNAGGRGLLRGVMRDRDGRVVLSLAQEMRLDMK
jgi:acyl-CoA thioesterase-2